MHYLFMVATSKNLKQAYLSLSSNKHPCSCKGVYYFEVISVGISAEHDPNFNVD